MAAFKNIPNHWQVKKLGDVCEILSGYGFPKNLQGSKVGKFPFYKVGDISKNVKVGNRQLELCDNYIDEKALLKLKAKPYPKNTIVFAKIGEGLKLNRRAIINTPGIVDNNAIGLKAIENICDDLFLYNFLTTVKLEDYSKATTVPSVRKSEIEEIFFPLPPLAEQKVIVSKIEELLSDLENGKQQLQLAQQKLKVYRQSLLKWAFEGRFGYVQRPSNYIKDGELPKGWKWVTVKDVCLKIIGGGTPSTKINRYWIGDIPWISSADIYGIKHIKPRRKITSEAIKNSAANLLPKGGIIVVTRVGLGKLAVAPFDLCFSQDSQGLVLNEKYLTTEYALWVLHQKVQIFKHQSRGTTINGVTKKQLADLLFPLPPLEEQHHIVSELESKLTVCDKIEEIISYSLQEAETLRQSILKKAFEGSLI